MAYRSVTGLLSIAALGCGGSSVHRLTDGGADAPGHKDAAKLDAEAPDATSAGQVTLAVTVDGAPASGAVVYFQNADSSLVAELSTGSDGSATQTMNAGGSVTLIEPALAEPDITGAIPQNTQLDTFADVQPGDVLHIDLGQLPENSVSFQLTVPTDPAATSYQLFSSCGDVDLESGEDVLRANVIGPNNVQLDDCYSSSIDMLVVTFDDNGDPLNALYSPNVPVSGGSAVVLTQSYTAMSSQSIADINVPAGVEFGSLVHDVVGPNGSLGQIGAPTLNALGNVELIEYEQPALPVISLVTQEFAGNGSSVLDNQTFADWGSAGTGSIVVDATAERLPDYVAAPTYDLTGEQVQWQVTGGGSGVTVDAVYTNVEFSRIVDTGSAEDGGILTSNATWSWDIVAPGTELGALAFPTVPSDVFAWNGSAGDGINVTFLEMANATGGYDVLRDNGIIDDFDQEIDTSTPSGHVVESTFSTVVEVGPPPTVAQQVRRHSHAWRTHSGNRSRK